MLKGKVLIVTGAFGIGKVSAIMFAACGAKLLVADWSEEGARDTADRIAKAGGRG